MPLDARSRICVRCWIECVRIHSPHKHNEEDCMTTIFVAHTQEDVQCAEQMRKGFEMQGYTAWREPSTLDPSSPTYPRIVETAILGSGAVILVWSASAAKSQWLQRFIAFAQRLQKQIVPVVIDGTSLPPTLLSVEQITGQTPYTTPLPQLLPFP